ncbi:MAG: hypothetical protein M1837_000727 [Sclerophora amabilis]|nr:MAG: hypothetical protein M1837_000727 [Sclerophora amabilis]
MMTTCSEPSLPPLPLPPPLPPPSTTDPNPSKSSLSRKRSSPEDHDACTAISSDPPLFSSDDHLASSSENYMQKRRKRQYRGTWWGDDVETRRDDNNIDRRPAKREFKRTVDSGVWLGSEGTNASDDDDDDGGGRFEGAASGAVAERLKAPDGAGVSRAWNYSLDNRHEIRDLVSPEQHETASWDDTPEARLDRIVQLCLEQGNECVDLSSLQLTSIPESSITPLNSLTKHPPVDQLPPSQEAYKPLTPSLHVFLSQNLLHSVPGAVLSLENLTVLSLRNNKLRELPPAIGRLTKLVELNVGGNRLQWLPGEILNLLGDEGCLSTLSIHPNPFVERNVEDDGDFHFIESIREKSRHHGYPQSTHGTSQVPKRFVQPGIEFVGASSVQYFHLDGSPLHTPPPRGDHNATLVHSLVELALRSCRSSSQLSHTLSLLPEDSPETLDRLLSEAQITEESGGQSCAVCGRDFLIARTEWIEWWKLVRCKPNQPFYSRTMMAVETLAVRRRGCSWRCISARAPSD